MWQKPEIARSGAFLNRRKWCTFKPAATIISRDTTGRVGHGGEVAVEVEGVADRELGALIYLRFLNHAPSFLKAIYFKPSEYLINNSSISANTLSDSDFCGFPFATFFARVKAFLGSLTKFLE